MCGGNGGGKKGLCFIVSGLCWLFFLFVCLDECVCVPFEEEGFSICLSSKAMKSMHIFIIYYYKFNSC